jgi:hypothetical protein
MFRPKALYRDDERNASYGRRSCCSSDAGREVLFDGPPSGLWPPPSDPGPALWPIEKEILCVP